MYAFMLWNFVRKSNNEYKRQAREASIGGADNHANNLQIRYAEKTKESLARG
jgi:hypothetical protein